MTICLVWKKCSAYYIILNDSLTRKQRRKKWVCPFLCSPSTTPYGGYRKLFQYDAMRWAIVIIRINEYSQYENNELGLQNKTPWKQIEGELCLPPNTNPQKCSYNILLGEFMSNAHMRRNIQTAMRAISLASQTNLILNSYELKPEISLQHYT